MFRPLLMLLVLMLSQPALSSPQTLTPATLAEVDRAALQATQDGDLLRVMNLLAPDFKATIQIPTDAGVQTLNFNRSEFLLYAAQARAAATGYRLQAGAPQYVIARDGRSAQGTRLITEHLRWDGQPLSYVTRRKSHYQPVGGRILITRLDVQVVEWDR